MKKTFCVTIFVLSSVICVQAASARWYKGNTHMHSTYSDGDSPLQSVVERYYRYGYDFLVATDHNVTIVADSIDLRGFDRDLLIIPGNELTHQSAHCTAIGITEQMTLPKLIDQWRAGELEGAIAADTAVESQIFRVQTQVNGILAAGGLPIINHPNFADGTTEQQMAAIKNVHHIEVFNAHPLVANFGKPGHIPVESKWDYMLSNGLKVYGLAADDAHRLKVKKAFPGQAWIMVRSTQLDQKHIIDAIKSGDFYASTGIELKRYYAGRGSLRTEIDDKKTQQNLARGLGAYRLDKAGVPGYTIEVVTAEGEVIHTTHNTKLNYKYDSINKYIRLRITYCVPHGDEYKTYFAWTQPLFE